MKFRDFLIRLIQTNIRKYLLFLLSTVFSMSTFFIFINLWYTDSFQKNTNGQMHTLMVIAATITVIFSVFIISYVHWHMLRERMKSFAVLLSYGFRIQELHKLMILETGMIYLVSLCLSYVTGSIFSRLFFMISIRLLSIDSNQIEYQLTCESFLVTAAVFFLIFALVLLIALVRISGRDLIALSKSKLELELTNSGSLPLGVFGIQILIGSIGALYLHNGATTEDMSQWILGCALGCLIGIYMIISHFSRLFYNSLKKNSKKYYRYILEASEFAMEYRRNRKTLFMLTLLTFGIILFTSVTYTLNKEAIRITEREHPQDLLFEELDAADAVDEKEINRMIAKSGLEVQDSEVLPFIYMKAPELVINNWRTCRYVPVVSETEFNQSFHTSFEVEAKEVRQFLFESDIDRDFSYFGEDIHLENEKEQYLFHSLEPVYDKILHRYTFTQAVLLVVDDTDYRRMELSATIAEKGRLYLYTFDDWRESDELCNTVASIVYQGYDEFASTDRSLYKELIERYGYEHLQVRSKAGFYDMQKMQGSFSLFIMGFVSILFLCCILITYHFKVNMNAEEDLLRLHKLEGIGMLQKEKDRLIKIRIRLLMFVPTVLGVLTGVAWCYALNFKKLLEIDLPNEVLFQNASVTGGLFLIILFLFYELLKNGYLVRTRQ